MRIRTCWVLWLAIGLLAGAAMSVAQRGPSTEEERQRIVELARKLQRNPLDRRLVKEREWAILWLMEAPDVRVSMCGRELGDFMDSKYEYKGEITAVSLLSAAAFVIEEPERGQDPMAQYQASAAGVVQAYRAILRSRNRARLKSLDELAAAEARGELPQMVERNAQACK